jgi:hypothetical protein
MNTTALIAELVIVGLQVMIWLSMIIALISGYNWLNPDNVEKIAAPLTVLLLAVSYTIGIVFDAFTAWLEDKLFSKQKAKERSTKRRILRQQLRLKDNALSLQLDNEQYLLRLLRSTALNLTLIATFGSILIFKAKLNGRFVYAPLLIGCAMMGLYGWCRRRKNFIRNRDAFYRGLEKAKRPSDGNTV